MSTTLTERRDGLVLECKERKRPVGRGSLAYPVPTVPTAGSSLLALDLVTVEGSGRKGIKITSTPPELPGAGTWTLQHLAYQGTRPEAPTWQAIPVVPPKVDHVLRDPAPSSQHVFRLRRVDAGQEHFYPEATIATPADQVFADLAAIVSDDVISRAEKPLFNRMVAELQSGITTDLAAATEWGVDSTALAAALADLVAWLGAKIPALSDLSQDTPLGTGGGATLTTKWGAVITAREALRQAVETARKQGLEAMLGDDKVTPGEKRRIKLERDQVQAAKGELDAVAIQSGISAATVDSAAAALEAFLDGLEPWDAATHDWDSYTTTSPLGTGNGALLYAKFKAFREAEAAFRQQVTGNLWQQVKAFGDDGILSKLEKPQVVVEFNRVQAEYPQLVYQAEAVGAYTGYFDAAFNALYAYMLGLTPAYSDTAQDTPLVAASWQARWGGYYAERTKLLGAMAMIANQNAANAQNSAVQALNMAPEFRTSLPTLPNPSYPEGRVVFLTQAWLAYEAGCYRVSGTNWVDAPFAAFQIIGQLVAGQISAESIGATHFAAVIAFVTQLLVGYAEDAWGVPLTGVKLDGRPGRIPLKVGPQGMMVGAKYVDEIALRALVALDSKAASSSDYGAWYKGACDPGVRNGAPDTSLLDVKLKMTRYSGGLTFVLWDFEVPPEAYNSNLDAMMGAVVSVLTSGGGVLTSINVPLSDRGYVDRVNHGHYANKIQATVPFFWPGDYTSGYDSSLRLQICLRNVYGYGPWYEFTPQPAGYSYGKASVWNSSPTGGAGGGGTTGGGGYARERLLGS